MFLGIVVCMELQNTAQNKHRLSPEQAFLIRTSPPAFLTIVEAAEVACCSVRKLRYLIKGNKLKCARVGKKIVIRRQTLDEFLGG